MAAVFSLQSYSVIALYMANLLLSQQHKSNSSEQLQIVEHECSMCTYHCSNSKDDDECICGTDHLAMTFDIESQIVVAGYPLFG